MMISIFDTSACRCATGARRTSLDWASVSPTVLAEGTGGKSTVSCALATVPHTAPPSDSNQGDSAGVGERWDVVMIVSEVPGSA